MDELISSAKSELEQLNAKVPEASEMPAGSGSVGRVVYTLEANGIEIKGTQYYMPIQGKICTVTLSTDQDGRQELFDRIGATMRPI